MAIPFSKHHFFQTVNQKAVLFTVFSLIELFFSCCIVTEVAKENLFKTLSIVSLANFQRIQALRHPRLTLDWLSVSFFDYWLIKMSGLLLLCTELPENCIYLSQSELSNFFMYIIITVRARISNYLLFTNFLKYDWFRKIIRPYNNIAL